MNPLQVGIVGCGAVGLYYGTRLLRAGAEVRFLMRSDAAFARSRGIEIRSGGNVELFNPVFVAASPEELSGVDWVLIATKATTNRELPELLAPAATTGARLLTLQNGIGHEEELRRSFPSAWIGGGLCFVCLNRIAPAVVEHFGHGHLVLGSASGPPDVKLRALADAFQIAGISAECTESLEEARWRKLVWNIPFNGLSIAGGGVPVSRILSDPALLERCRGLMLETCAVSAARGFPIPSDFVEHQITRTLPMGDYKPSSLLDFLAGKPVELDAIWGAPLRIANSLHVETPLLRDLFDQLAGLCRLSKHP